MIAVLFEVEPRPGQASRYFDLAARLGADLQAIPGFVSVERFESVTRPGVFLSLSWWDNEEAVERWRNHAPHREGQREGRQSVFAAYRIRVVRLIRDYSHDDRSQAPADSNAALR